MKAFGGWQFPDHEMHLIEWLTKVNDVNDSRQRYQGKKQIEAMKWCKQFRVAVDVGAHVGLFSYYLAQKFQTVEAFEPVAAHRECFIVNVTAPTVNLHAVALGDHDALIGMHTSNGSSGDSWVNGLGDIPLARLDSFNLQDVDFIKLDCEGGELAALRGAEETIMRCAPCIMVEQKKGRAQKYGLKETEAVTYLESMGATVRRVMSGDFILTF